MPLAPMMKQEISEISKPRKPDERTEGRNETRLANNDLLSSDFDGAKADHLGLSLHLILNLNLRVQKDHLNLAPTLVLFSLSIRALGLGLINDHSRRRPLGLLKLLLANLGEGSRSVLGDSVLAHDEDEVSPLARGEQGGDGRRKEGGGRVDGEGVEGLRDGSAA